MSETPRDPRLAAQERMERRRAKTQPAPSVVAPVHEPAQELLFANQVILGLVEAGALIPRSRLDRALEVLGIEDPPSVAAVQIDTDLQITLVRRRHTGRTSHLTREHIPIVDIPQEPS